MKSHINPIQNRSEKNGLSGFVLKLAWIIPCMLIQLVQVSEGRAQVYPPTYTLDSVRVEATKFPFAPYEMPASITILTRDQFADYAGATLSDILANTQGLQAYDFSGSGTHSIIDIRGFASSGETSYLRLLINGFPVNELNGDNVDWNLIGLDQIERIEILRGPTSALHGNIGMSGLVNVVTRVPEEGLASSVSLTGGDQNRQGLGANLLFGNDKMQISLFGKSQKIDGWRNHSDWQAHQLHTIFKADLGQIDQRKITFAFNALYLDFDREDPGAIPLAVPTHSASTSIDKELSQKWLLATSLQIPLLENLDFELMGSTRGKNAEVVKTIFFQPKNRDIATKTYRIEARLRHRLHFGGRSANLLLGAERESGRLDNAYYEVSPGTGSRAFLATDEQTRRRSMSSYAQVHMNLVNNFSLIGGMRYDQISDNYFSLITPDRNNTEMKAMSSSFALNWQWASASNVYGSVSRSFKAPTLEQLYDQRPFYIAYDLPPIKISNGSLRPQHAMNYEIGLRTHHRNGISSDLSLYYIHVENEIGFDLANFSYANIEESKHVGMEVGVNFPLNDKLQFRQGYTMTRATFAGGEYDGNQINGVPRNILLSSLSYRWSKSLSTAMEIQHTRDQFIDEGNRYPIDAYTVVNVRLGYAFEPFHLDISIRNLLDRDHYVSGYLTQTQDQAGNLLPLPLFYPGRQRSAMARVSVRF